MKLAITGTIGSGKSTVARYIRNKGYFVFDADECNRKLLEKGNLGYLAVKDAFPEVFVDDDLIKSKLAKIIFHDKSKRDVLENIMHPLILDIMKKEMKKHDVFFAEIPLLFEENWDKYFDHNLLIVTDKEIAKKRLINRGLSYSESEERINNQMSIKDKVKRADEIIYNNSDLPTLYKEVDKWLEKYVG